MLIERFEAPGLAQFSYLVAADGQAAVIDPIRDIDRYLAFAADHHLAITHILETHIHADFASGAVALAEATGATLALSAYDHEGGESTGAPEIYHYAMAHRELRDGDAITFGSARLEAVHTPGHTPEHLSFVLFDTIRSATVPVALFSGDFLFVGSVGRPDLLGEAAKNALAHQLYQSLHHSIAGLPDGVTLYPGHGAGSLCGAGLSSAPESTLGYERIANPLFGLDEESFVATVLASVPPMPTFYPRMKKLNSAGAPALTPIPGGSPLSVEMVDALPAESGVTLVDLRQPQAFAEAHIPGSINVGAGANLPLWAGWLLDPTHSIVLIGSGADEEASRRALIRVGLDNLHGYLEGGMAAWIAAGKAVVSTGQITATELAGQLVSDTPPFVVDVRNLDEFGSGHIASAIPIPLGDLARSLDQIPRDRPVTTVCGSAYRSSIAASILQQHQFTQVSSMEGGIAAWSRSSLPLVRQA